MKRALLILLVLVVVSVLMPSRGGEYRCPHTAQECLDEMTATLPQRGFFGVDGVWLDEIKGYRIDHFLEGSHLPAAGIRTGDIMIAVNGIPLADEKGSYADRANRRPGKTVKLTVRRGDEEIVVAVELIRLSDDQIALLIGRHLMDEHATKRAAHE